LSNHVGGILTTHTLGITLGSYEVSVKLWGEIDGVGSLGMLVAGSSSWSIDDV